MDFIISLVLIAFVMVNLLCVHTLAQKLVVLEARLKECSDRIDKQGDVLMHIFIPHR